MTFNNNELMLILMILCGTSIVFGSYSFYKYFLYRDRKLTYPLFKVRDDIIMLVGQDIIKKDNEMFQFYYKSIINSINAVHSDFFRIGNLYNIIKDIDLTTTTKDEKEHIRLLGEQPEEFQNTIIELYQTIENIIISKNLWLKPIVSAIKTFKQFTLLWESTKKIRSMIWNQLTHTDYAYLNVIDKNIELIQSIQ